MPAILAQMGGDAVGSTFYSKVRGAQRIGMQTAACVPERRHVINVDAKAYRSNGRGQILNGLTGNARLACHGICVDAALA
jgi:hypothetical protein